MATRQTFQRFTTPALLLAFALAGCTTAPITPRPRPAVIVTEPQPEPAWRGIVQPADLDRLARLGSAWEQALALARATGASRRVRGEGVLLDPAIALPRAALPPGSYRCRLIRIGAVRRGRGAYAVQGPFFCFVGAEEANLSFTQQTGSDRPGGYIYDDLDNRQILIAARARGREQLPPAYSEQPERDVVGVVERIGNFRYRIVIPWPRNGAILEVMELIAAPA
jgi:hypothetical protein